MSSVPLKTGIPDVIDSNVINRETLDPQYVNFLDLARQYDELKYQNDGQTAYEKVPHAVFKYIFHNPKKLDVMWLLLFGKGWETILDSPSGERILGHIQMLQDNTDTEIIIIKNID